MASQAAIALVSTACRFPDAASPAELWANVVEGRRSFRAIPPARIDIARYAPDLVGEAESITPIRAGLLTDWTVDRARLRIPKGTYDATDLTHWLALTLAAEAVDAVGGSTRLDSARTAVVVANTLTGEFSRAALLRLRLPFLEDVLLRVADREGLSNDATVRLRDGFAAQLRHHFADPNEDSLAGGLANTIAGRIANHLDLHGGAYSVDGACASSLLALADAANLILTEQIDAAIVAAVDLSLDPFELVGFSRNGALAADTMRVFDARSNGFWPGEGGACVVLMREDEALRRELPVLARLRGWGISSDGAGGLTRPTCDGQLTACHRAYEMANTDPADVAFIEAHGTGTAVGDPIEVRALGELRRDARTPLPIGSIKANIGHTKAAAGLAGLLKAIEAVRHGILPQHVSCDRPHQVFSEVDGCVRPILANETLSEGKSLFAGVSSFGFGGINAHVVIENAQFAATALNLPRPAPQDAELFLFAGDSAEQVMASIAALECRAPTMGMSELTDAAAARTAVLPKSSSLRVAVVAGNGEELAERLVRARAALLAGETLSSVEKGVFVSRTLRQPRIGFLFPGQGAPCRPDGGLWYRRFHEAAELLELLPPVSRTDPNTTEIAQPTIAAGSLAAVRILKKLGVSAAVAAGHSLGELAALAWAGAWTDKDIIHFARKRGELMAQFGAPCGRMLRVALPAEAAASLARKFGVVVACHNSRCESVVSGPAHAVEKAAAHCAAREIETTALAVSHAFHSPDMAPVVPALEQVLATVTFAPLMRTVVSTVSGAPLDQDADIRKLLLDQLTMPVLFDRAIDAVKAQADLLIEVGPGRSLTRLLHDDAFPVLSVDAFADSLRPLLTTVGALFTAGVDIDPGALFDRPTRAFEASHCPRFIESPCGVGQSNAGISDDRIIRIESGTPAGDRPIDASDPLHIVRAAVVDEAGLDAHRIGADDRFLDTLHLNSLSVSRIVAAAAKAMQICPPSAPTEFANATPRLLANALQELKAFEPIRSSSPGRIGGVRPWVRTYGISWLPADDHPRPGARPPRWLTAGLKPDAAEPPSFFADKDGLLIWIDEYFDDAAAKQLILLTAAAAKAGISHLAICHHGAPVGAFARSVAQERHFRSVRVIERPLRLACDLQLKELLHAEFSGYEEIRLSESGGAEKPAFLPKTVNACPSAAIGRSDVVVVAGGGKGIAAECALHLGRTGAALVLVGRSPPDDPDVAETLERARARQLNCRYVQADVLDLTGFSQALEPALTAMGQATVLIYAPAVNEPKRVVDLDEETIQHTLAPKIAGLQNALIALRSGLRRLITFSSIIGRIGLEGESHYALANAMQSAASDSWAIAGTDRTALSIEWSIWGGTGMGERLGTIDRLGSMGVDAISVDDALEQFDGLVAHGACGTVAVTGRFGPPPNLAIGPRDLPFLRFVDEPKVHFPGVELVVETSLNQGTDRYLDDHVIDGRAVLPAVMGLEAMAQVAGALSPLGRDFAVRNLVFKRAVSVPPDGALRIRIAALCADAGQTETVLLAEDDGFAAPCMQATFSAERLNMPHIERRHAEDGIQAARLYGPLFFGGPRFQRLARIDKATSRHVIARFGPSQTDDWFGAYQPDAFVLGNPGLADAALHALQAAVPHRLVLPISAASIGFNPDAGPAKSVHAVERFADGDTYVFDLHLLDANGRVTQYWQHATFRAVDIIDIRDVLTAAPELAVPYLERRAREAFCDDSLYVAYTQNSGSTRESRRDAALALLGLRGTVDRRGDGRPIRLDGTGSLSIAHQPDTTLAVMANGSVSCDIESASGVVISDAIAARRHLALEACRKLGRWPAADAVPNDIDGRPHTIGDVELILINLPVSSGNRTVAFGRLRSNGNAIRPEPDLSALEKEL